MRRPRCCSRWIAWAKLITPVTRNSRRSTRRWHRPRAVNLRPKQRSRRPSRAFVDEAALFATRAWRSRCHLRYLIERSPAGARAVEETIRTTVRMLEQFPSGGRALQQRPDVRVAPTPRFPLLIFYTTGADELVILHIRHAARAQLTADHIERAPFNRHCPGRLRPTPARRFRAVAAQRDRPPRRMVAMHLAPLKCGEKPCL